MKPLRIVKIIKFYAWELAIENRVKELRNKESGKVGRYLLLIHWLTPERKERKNEKH